MNLKSNILIIKHGSFGDLVRACVFINAIKKFHENSNIILLTSAVYAPIIKKNPDINEVLIDNRESLFKVNYLIKLRKKLLAYNFHLIYDLQNSQRTFLYKKFMLNKHRWITTNREKHPVSGLRGLADMLKKEKVSFPKDLISDISWMVTDVSKILINKKIKNKFILFIPGSSKKNEEKRWPYFADLIKIIIKKKIEVLSVLGPEEQNLEKNLPGKILKNLNWQELAGIIKASSFIISNDTGPVHIAACLKKSGLIFYGPTDPVKVGLNQSNFMSARSKKLNDLKPEFIYKKYLKALKI